ncbi:MAG: GNAT family N-acetyltransferase [Planctomycetia bacterium]
MVTYRTFRNDDPPHILELWNSTCQRMESQVGMPKRSFGYLSGCFHLEQLLFSKPYFDAAGLQLAFDNRKLVGLCHAGFGCNDEETRLDPSMGVVGMLLVHPDHRRRGVGTELLSRAQQYLRARGSNVQYAGSMHPLNPFYLGLYGGSELPGVLDTDGEMTQFLLKRGYVVADTCHVYQRMLDRLPTLDDNRIPLLRRNVELLVEPTPTPLSWWHACTLGPMITLGYELIHRTNQAPIGTAWVWEMETYVRSWGVHSVGVTNFQIVESERRKGYGKLLLYSILKHLKEQGIGLVEVQTMERNQAARGMYDRLGFSQVDSGHVYRLNETP